MRSDEILKLWALSYGESGARIDRALCLRISDMYHRSTEKTPYVPLSMFLNVGLTMDDVIFRMTLYSGRRCWK